MTGAELLRDGVAALRGAGVDTAAGDARRLLAAALGIGGDRLTLVLAEPVEAGAARRFRAHLAARAGRMPVSRILGQRAFYGRNFRITADVLDPRPETETLVARALDRPFRDVIDLGTGSGCILATLLAERPQSRGVGADVSAAALAVARDNAARLDVAARSRWIRSDWWAGIEGAFDLIVSNPPYIPTDEMAGLAPEVRDHDPAGALSPGGDGLDAYRAIAAGLAAHAAPGARILLEIGPRQATPVADLLTRAGCVAVARHRDLDGRERVIGGVMP